MRVAVISPAGRIRWTSSDLARIKKKKSMMRVIAYGIHSDYTDEYLRQVCVDVCEDIDPCLRR
jgi:hypothetical protein